MNEPIYHRLKIKDCFLQNICSGKKKAEVRKDDRDYQVGDIIQFKTKIDKNAPMCGNSLYEGDYLFHDESFVITHVLRGCQYGIVDDYVVLSIEKEKENNT